MAEPCVSSEIHEQHMSKSTNSEKEEQNARSKHKCPYPSCQSSVIHLPRHMRKCHGWSPRKARSVLNSFDLRKAKSNNKRKTKRSYKSVICPVTDCNSVVKRIHNHLINVHKMKRTSKSYKQSLACVIHHNVDPVTSSESSESAELSDESVLSLGSYKPPKKKEKKKIHVKRLDNFYETVYGSSDSNDSPLQSDNGNSQPTDLSFPSIDQSLDSNDPECDLDISNDDDANVKSSPVFDAKLDAVFDNFQTWLQGADGGRKSDRSAVQCRRQVELIVSYINSSNPSLSTILHKSSLRDKWLHKFEKEKQPGTVKSYIGSLLQFYAFLKCENVEVGVSSEKLAGLSQQVKLWACSIRKKSMDRFWEKRMDDISTMRTPQQVKEFDTSEVAREAVRLLGVYQVTEDKPGPTQPEYTSVRDYLLTVLCINNGSRSGPLANMTLLEFEKATKDDGCFVVRVKDHKTFTTHGPANVVFTATLYRYTQIFIEKFRNQLDGVSTNGDSTVFLTVTMKKLNSSQVGSQIGSCWGKVFGRETSSGGATAFRKAAVSAVHECNEDMRGDLANLMVHKQSTADRYYLLQNKGKSAVKTSKELMKIMRQGTEKGSSNNATEDVEPTEINEKSNEHSSNSSRRHKWTSAQKAELESVFSSNIDKQSVTMEEVRKTLRNVPLLQDIGPKKILDKVRSYFGKNDRESDESPSLPAEQESFEERLKRAGLEKTKINHDLSSSHEITSQDELIGEERDSEIDPNNRSANDSNQVDNDDDDDDSISVKKDRDEYAPSISGSKKTMQSLLTIEEDEIFSATFSKLINSSRPISMKNVVALIKKEAKLCHLLKTFTHRQLADRVRSIRKATVRANEQNKLQKKHKK